VFSGIWQHKQTNSIKEQKEIEIKKEFGNNVPFFGNAVATLATQLSGSTRYTEHAGHTGRKVTNS
jgi:hypothetical protein